jgi:site-specific DNA-methyltransferase (adenine-specific)
MVYTGDGWEVVHADALAWLNNYDGEPFAGVIADPPYSSGGATRGDRVASTRTKYVNSDSGNQDRLPDFEGDNRDARGQLLWCTLWLMAAWRASRHGATIHLFTDWRQLPIMSDALQAGGWVWRGTVPWNKTLASRPTMGRHRAQCEYSLFGTKGPHRAYEGAPALPGFFECPVPRERIHITEKPVQLIQEIVQTTPPGGLVLDPFCGSGAHAVGCLREGRRVVSLEIVPEIAAEAAERLEAESRGLTLDDARRGQTSILDLTRE